MSKKKRTPPAATKRQPPAAKGVGPATWIAGAVALVAIVAVIMIGSNKGQVPAAAATAGSPAAAASSSGGVPPEEAKYIGRLLPASYTEPSVSDAVSYSSSLAMANVTAAQGAKQTSLAVSDVVANKIVFFEYQKADGKNVPMVAYVKPSGKLFVGVSFCIPCQGTAQTIEADGTLRCSACGTKRDLETGVGISGGCKLYPLDELPAKVAGGKIVIENSAIDGWTTQPLDRPSGGNV